MSVTVTAARWLPVPRRVTKNWTILSKPAFSRLTSSVMWPLERPTALRPFVASLPSVDALALATAATLEDALRRLDALEPAQLTTNARAFATVVADAAPMLLIAEATLRTDTAVEPARDATLSDALRSVDALEAAQLITTARAFPRDVADAAVMPFSVEVIFATDSTLEAKTDAIFDPALLRTDELEDTQLKATARALAREDADAPDMLLIAAATLRIEGALTTDATRLVVKALRPVAEFDADADVPFASSFVVREFGVLEPTTFLPATLAVPVLFVPELERRVAVNFASNVLAVLDTERMAAAALLTDAALLNDTARIAAAALLEDVTLPDDALIVRVFTVPPLEAEDRRSRSRDT